MINLFNKKPNTGFIPNIAIPDSSIKTIPVYTYTCVICGDTFTSPTNNPNIKYCSINCSREPSRRKYIESKQVTFYKQCICCQEWFITNSKSQIYCNESCVTTTRKRDSSDILTAIEIEYLYEKYNFTCQVCLNSFEPESLAIHHVIPIALGGITNEDNLTLLCQECHGRQHTREIWNEIRRSKNNAKLLLFLQRQQYKNTPFFSVVIFRH